jgi:hypothetical protein
MGGRFDEGRMSAQQSAVSAVSQPLAAPRSLGRSLEQNGTLVLVVAAFVIVLLASLRHALDIDGWMAFASGREIAQHGLPSHDLLTVWTHGRRWIDQEWLAQLSLYGLWRLGGLKLALLVHVLLAGGALAGAAALGRRLGGSARAATWVCLPALVAYYPEAAVLRPQTFAYPLFAALLWLLATDARRPSRRVFAVVPILVLWANLHGSVVLGAALTCLAGLVRVASKRGVVGGALLVVIGWPCVLASPYAAHLPSYYRTVLHGGNFSHFVTEWAPTTLTASTAPVYLLVFAGVWLIGRSGSRISLFEKVAFAALGVLAFDAVRNTAWLGLAAIALLPTLVDTIRPQSDELRRMNRMLATVMLAGLLVAFAGVAAKATDWFVGSFPPPAAAAASAAAGPDGKVFATSSYADWLLWARPELRGRVAFDARYELLDAKQVAALGRFQGRVGNWRHTVAGYDVVVLSQKHDDGEAKALLATGSFRKVLRDGDVIVLRRSRA